MRNIIPALAFAAAATAALATPALAEIDGVNPNYANSYGPAGAVAVGAVVGTAAPGSACRWCVPSSNCTAAP